MKKRNYTQETVRKLQGSIQIEHTLAKRGAEKLRALLANEPYINTLGAYNGQMAVQHAKAGLKAIYLSGWQVAAANNTQNTTYPDQSLYPVDSVPRVVKGINNAFPLNVSVISQTGIVCKHTKNTSVASASTSTMSYTVTAGKTLYLKGVIATSSGAPCKVTIDDGTNTYATGFYSAAMPYLAMDFVQPPSFAAGTVINVKVENNADAAQDVYSTIMGEER